MFAKHSKDMYVPLAEKMRPTSLQEIEGQTHLVGTDGILTKYVSQQYLPSLVLWGPPGSGKTTIARLLASQVQYEFKSISAVFSGVRDIKSIFDEAQVLRDHGTHVCLFIDEIHRFNKSQQDGFLHAVEEGLVSLIGATTENPSFEINGALLSRMQVCMLTRLDDHSLIHILHRALDMLTPYYEVTEEARDYLVQIADGDARRLLNTVEQVHESMQSTSVHAQKHLIEKSDVETVAKNVWMQYDKTGEQHYNLISALHKSVRGSDCDAALYWLVRMLLSGEDARYLLRRLLRLAYEDVGLADPNAAGYVIDAWNTYERLGSPEGEIALAQVTIYLSLAPKSNRVYTAMSAAMNSAKQNGSLSPPMHIVNAPTSAMKSWGYGAGYMYDHDTEEGMSGQNYYPDGMERQTFYVPIARGFEREMQRRLQYFTKMRAMLSHKNNGT